MEFKPEPIMLEADSQKSSARRLRPRRWSPGMRGVSTPRGRSHKAILARYSGASGRSVGITVSPYEVIERLGEGGMGIVYKARDRQLGRLVALKVLRPMSVPDHHRRFLQEARLASALNHPNIVTTYAFGRHNGWEFLSMEFVQGKTLSELIDRAELTLNDSLNYAVQIAGALAAAHSRNIIHRDLKPANVMVSSQGVVKVLDFGLAKLAKLTDIVQCDATRTMANDEAPLTERGAILGTVSYMSPEQARGREIDGRSDIFSFGALLYEMVTGRRAFQGETAACTVAAILRDDPRPVEELAPSVPVELKEIISSCLRKNPRERYQDMQDVKVGLEKITGR